MAIVMQGQPSFWRAVMQRALSYVIAAIIIAAIGAMLGIEL